jgi:hypothetical protein
MTALRTVRASASLLLGMMLAAGLLGLSAGATAETVAVKNPEGAVRAFLVLKSLDGTRLADGDLIQSSRGDRVTTHVVFHFKDGSIHDETVVFSQRGTFRLVRDHLLQKGPSFRHPVESSVDAATGRVSVRYFDDKGKDDVTSKRMKLPADVSNGLMFTLLKNISVQTPTTVSMVAASASPRLVKVVKLVFTPSGTEAFTVGGASHKAVRYVVKTEIGGVAGAVAPLVGKEPADISVWILPGDVPTFVKSEGPLFFGGPVWRIEPACPAWPEKPTTPTPE